MSSSGWTRGPVCGVDNCQSRLWRMIDGRMVCQFGHVNEYALDFNDEDENAENFGRGGITRRLNNVSGLSQTGARHRIAERIQESQKETFLYGSQLNLLLVRALQIVLAKQCQKVASIYGVDTKLYYSIVRNYWCVFLAHFYKDQSSAGKRCNVSLQDTLLICYLSLLKLGVQPIYLIDFLNLADLGMIPSAKAVNCLPPSLFKKIPPSAYSQFVGFMARRRRFFDFNRVIGIKRVMSDLSDLKFVYLPLLTRFVLQMYLPLEVIPLTEKLIDLCQVKLNYIPGKLHPEMKLYSAFIATTLTYFKRNPKLYSKWIGLYFANRKDPSRFNVDIDPVSILGEVRNHSRVDELLRWNTTQISEITKLFYRYYYPEIKNDNISPTVKDYGSQKIIFQRLAAIFPIDDTFDHTKHTLKQLEDHIIAIYKRLYSFKEIPRKIDTDKVPSTKLLDILADNFKIFTGLTFDDFSDVWDYAHQLLNFTK